MNIRNVAIIAHVDHGKTTLVDAFLKQAGVFRTNQEVADRVLDSNDLERERGITILAKNVSIKYNEYKINIVDTPGHADFGGEVERILSMVDGALLVVDAVEGPMPQTRFVLQKALTNGLAPIVVVNKVDRPFADPDRVVDQVFDLFVTLGANDQQLDFPVYYASAITGIAADNFETFAEAKDMLPVLDGLISHIPAPSGDPEGDLQLLISNIDYDDYVGRICIGRIHNGVIKNGQQVSITHSDNSISHKGKIGQLYTFAGLKRVPINEASSGDIVAFSGIEDIQIGETINAQDRLAPLPAIKVDEPTLNMVFRVNDGPFAGQDGEYLTSRHIRERLLREAKTNVALRVNETSSPDAFQVSGRGELHLSILIETMRREGYEFCVSKPEPILQHTDEGILEPYEYLMIDVPQDYLGAVMELVGNRKGEMQGMEQLGENSMRVSFEIPARGLIGFGSTFLTETKGYGIMYHSFSHYGKWAADLPERSNGSLIAWEDGVATSYALQSIEQRGILFLEPGTKVYEGMIVGENSRTEDLPVNVAKRKQVTNMRAAGSDDHVKLSPPRNHSLEQALAFLAKDEYLEVTPLALRLRKAILGRSARERASKSK